MNEFFEACRLEDAHVEEHIDRLLSRVSADRLASGVDTVLASGIPEDWPAALNLVGLLANESQELWTSLIRAIETRQDLQIPDLMEAVALLNQANRLPEKGRCFELAEEWAEATAGHSEVETLIRLIEEDPEDAASWLGEIVDWSDAERGLLIEQLRDHKPGHGRDTLISWIESIESDRQHDELAESMEHELSPELLIPTWDLAIPEIRPLWITDLTDTGTFGAGLETVISSPHVRIVVAGSLFTGMQYANSFEPADDNSFEPRMPEGRNLSFHPVLVRQMIRELVRIGFAGKSVPARIDSIFESLLREISPKRESDAAQWERWTRILVDSNPLDRRPGALSADARETLDGLNYWLVPDPLAKELASEFRSRNDDTEIDRVRGVMRVWFERSLGPRMGGLIEALSQMGYFWLSLGELDGLDEPSPWHSRARASARIVADLSDPSRVVATHPFVEQFMLRVFVVAAGQR
ncbi:hypothetical protein GC170_06325 [bacterium]|nr:hypothetical protein [bacterium]